MNLHYMNFCSQNSRSQSKKKEKVTILKIKTRVKSYDEVMAIPQKKHKRPMKQSLFFRTLLRIVSIPDLLATHFKVEKIGMEKLGRREPCLILMNHSSFIDLKIASTVLFPRPFNVVCTSDGFVGMNLLMRLLGCIPTNKFVFDVGLVRDMNYAVKKLKSSILLYPEASYSFDGTATPLPETVGGLVKMMSIPVVTIRTFGAFARQPLYNNLRRRRVDVSAEMRYLLSPDEIKQMSAAEINEAIGAQFSFDAFRWQKENGVRIDEPDRAEALNRVLYKCPACHAEGKTEGRGDTLTCHACKKIYRMDEYGAMHAKDGNTEFSHIPDWYAWQRSCVRDELLDGGYRLDCEVDIYMMVNTKCIYRVGDGRLVHTREGFHLTGCDGKLDYSQKAVATYSLYSDFYWYEIGDVICIGNKRALYYCFPKGMGDIVAKTRLATEELYKLVKRESVPRAEKNGV